MLPLGTSYYGANDMAGNVWEWVEDWHGPNYYRNSPASNPKGPIQGDGKVLRGGSWANTKEFLRSAHRMKFDPATRDPTFGFRCASSPSKGSHNLAEQGKIVGQLDSPTPGELPKKITGNDGAPMVLVPAGEFTMGAREDDKLAQADERPAHTVYLDSFYIDQFEVTTTLYGKFFQEKKRDPPRYWSKTVLKKHGNKPVVGVTWKDSNVYCEWAGKRLPTEEEWEKAARGTDQRLYPWGNEAPNEKLANFNNCCDFKDYGVLRDVGSFEGGKSPFGAYDMGGNVWEWVGDWYEEKLYQRRVNLKAPFQNPRGPEKKEFRVLRGGSWSSGDGDTRSTNRYWNYPTYGNFYYGFRCAGDAKNLASFNLETQQPPLSQKEPLKIPDKEPVRKENVKAAVKSPENAQYFVAVYSYKVDVDKVSKVRKYFKDQGYTLRTGWRLQTRPIWLASESTVFYYDKKSKVKAAFIAEALKQEVHTTFAVKRGAGLGVIKGQEKRTFYVHYLDN